MKQLILFSVIIFLLFSSCSVEKRIYRPGFYIQRNDNSRTYSDFKRDSLKENKFEIKRIVQETLCEEFKSFDEVLDDKKNVKKRSKFSFPSAHPKIKIAIRKKDFGILISPNSTIRSKTKIRFEQPISSGGDYGWAGVAWFVGVLLAIFIILLIVWLFTLGGMWIFLAIIFSALDLFFSFVLWLLFMFRDGE